MERLIYSNPHRSRRLSFVFVDCEEKTKLKNPEKSEQRKRQSTKSDIIRTHELRNPAM